MDEKNLKTLDEVCGKVLTENGTIRTQVIDYDYYIKKEILKCLHAGATREEISEILLKYLK